MKEDPNERSDGTSLAIKLGILIILVLVAMAAWYFSPLGQEYRLNRACERRDIPTLLQYTFGKETAYRLRAMHCLSKTQDLSLIPVFDKCMNDPNVAVRGQAMENITELAGEEAVPSLARHLTDPERGSRIKALRWIGVVLHRQYDLTSPDSPSKADIQDIDAWIEDHLKRTPGK